MKAIHNSLIEARLWWDCIGRRDASRRFEIANAARPSQTSCQNLARVLHIVVPEAIRERRRILDQSSILRQDHGNQVPGRILLYDYESTLSDGLAESETDGLLDVHNCPPSGFWLGLVPWLDEGAHALGHERVLVSWIPTELAAVISQGINVIAEGCVDWADSETWKDTQLGKELSAISHL